MNHLINLASDYFNAWNSNDVEQLKPMLSEDVTLVDWDINEQGFDAVVAANQRIFDTVPGIRAEVLGMATTGNSTVFAQLRVHISETESIDVVDIITYNGIHLTSIKAYKG